MNRSFRGANRQSFVGGRNYDDSRSYIRQGGSNYMERDMPLRADSLMGPPPSYGLESSSLMGSPSYGLESSSLMGSPSYGLESSYERGGYDRDVVESRMQERALEQQLSLRDSQLALTSSLLHKQQGEQQQQQFNKRRMSRPDMMNQRGFKRPRMDSRSQSGNRPSNTGGRDPNPTNQQRTRGTNNRGTNNRRGRARQPNSSGRQLNSSGRQLNSSVNKPKPTQAKPKSANRPKKPTAEEDDGPVGVFHCKACKEDFKDAQDLKQHVSTTKHKNKMLVYSQTKKEGGGNKGYFCKLCDETVNVSRIHHTRQVVHRKRMGQVNRGCGWCSVTSFKNFSEVLTHRETQQHQNNQKLYGKERTERRGNNKSQVRKKREPIKVVLPEELIKYDEKVMTGQTCVVAVTGWFCKLCTKFYNNETAAKETHCMAETHFNNFKKFTYAKLRAKAAEERDAKEKAAEEEEKKKQEEEEAKEKEEGGEEMEAEESEEKVEENGLESEVVEEAGDDEAVLLDRFVDPHKPNPSPVLHVRELSGAAIEADLVEAVQHFGAVRNVLMMPRRKQALIEFEDLNGARNCVEYVQSSAIDVAGQPALFNFSTRQKIQIPG